MSGERDITIYDIAKKLNISAATVSRGLKDHPGISDATKKRIKDTAAELGYRFNTFASNLRRQRTNTIGVIVPRLNSSFMSDVIAGIERIANEEAYNLIISQSLERVKKESQNAATMFNSRVDGLLVSLAYNTESIAHFEKFMEKDIPLIFFDRVFAHEKCPRIVIDNYKAGYEATQHLIEQGCRRILHITGSQQQNVYKDRHQGYYDALINNELPVLEELTIVNNLDHDAGIAAATSILTMPIKPDGVFVANDTCAVACMIELRKNGISIPDEIAFVGFNNDPLSKVVEPNLSTINYHGEEMGELAAKVLIAKLSGSDNLNAFHHLLKHELIVRESSLRK